MRRHRAAHRIPGDTVSECLGRTYSRPWRLDRGGLTTDAVVERRKWAGRVAPAARCLRVVSVDREQRGGVEGHAGGIAAPVVQAGWQNGSGADLDAGEPVLVPGEDQAQPNFGGISYRWQTLAACLSNRASVATTAVLKPGPRCSVSNRGDTR